eukprot:Seg1819.2 transcript_id=Seg1819.2/GoldUCD/mRNA.D3Y31 product="Protein brambleberry" protein_id=Seg1819.2/GoldUCD/D3Y31
MSLLYRLMITVILVQSNLIVVDGFWWFFSSEEEEKPSEVAETKQFEKVFAPFEITEVESKFLSEASHYLNNLPKLDQCNLLIINRLKSSCNKLTEVDVSKLSVNLLNCQSAVEGRKIYKCTDDMALSDCTKDMDPDTWNAYHVVSNRARAVCYSVRQKEFRIKTEITINSLAASAKDNLVSLQQLLESQKDLENKTSETISKVVDGGDKAIKVQTELNIKQKTLKQALADNLEKLSREKNIIEARQMMMKKHSKEVKKDLDEIAGAIKRHHVARTSSDKELLSQVEAIQTRAKDVLVKLDEAVNSMDNHYVKIEQRHTKIIENVQEIQKAINFVSEMIVNFEDTFHNQMKWINDAVGGTRDKLSVISILFGHIVQFAFMFFVMVFCGSPLLSKATLLVLLPMNCVFALQQKQHFTYKEILVVVTLTYPAHWCYYFFGSTKAGSLRELLKYDKVSFEMKKSVNKLMAYFKGRFGKKEARERKEEAKGCEDLEMSDEEQYEADQSVVTSTPQRPFRDLLHRSHDRSHDTSRDHSFGNETISVQRRCGSLTRTGQRCKSFCKRGSTSCSRHDNSYNSYLEHSNVVN